MVKFRNVVWLPLDVQQVVDELTQKLKLPSNVFLAQIVVEHLGKDGNLKEVYIKAKYCPICGVYFQNGAEATAHIKKHKAAEFTLKSLLSKRGER